MDSTRSGGPFWAARNRPILMLALAAAAFSAGLLAVETASHRARNPAVETAAIREWGALITPHGPDR
jgi:hypothetical protein